MRDKNFNNTDKLRTDNWVKNRLLTLIGFMKTTQNETLSLIMSRFIQVLANRARSPALLFLGANNLSTSAKIFLYLSIQMRIAVI